MALAYLDLAPGQRTTLDGLPFEGNHLVDGPPGSGKSLLAVQRALMLAFTGRQVVLLTRSNLLRQALAPVATVLGAEEAGVEVSTVHSWLSRTYGNGVRRTEDGWFDWPACYQRAAQAEEGRLALVVDEGQDLPPDFYRLCRVLRAETTVFADECQRLTDSQSTLREIIDGLGRCARHRLSGNHRNTRQIAELAAHFHTGAEPPALPDREGPTPRLHRLAGFSALTDRLIALARKNPRHSIGVVVASSRTQFELLTRLERRAPRLEVQMYTAQASTGRYRNLDLARPGLVLVHRASAKGLDFDTVVVPDAHADGAADPTAAQLRMTYYVLATRARRELHFAHGGTSEPALFSDVPAGLLARV